MRKAPPGGAPRLVSASVFLKDICRSPQMKRRNEKLFENVILMLCRAKYLEFESATKCDYII